jgi:hypothetical protein
VQHGFVQDAPKYLEVAAKVSEDPGQDWRWDRVRVRIAQTQLLLGQMKEAEKNTKDLEPSETGKLAVTKAQLAVEASFEEQLAEINGLLLNPQFDIRRNGMDAAVELMRRFHGDTDKRRRVTEKLRESLRPVPVFVRIEALLSLAEAALDHKDQAGALEWVNEAQRAADEVSWPLVETRLPVMAKLARYRYLAGDTVKGRADADAVLALFEAKKEDIQDFDRAGAILPLAETYQAIGDKAAALAVFRKAVEEGSKNINARTRALDLTAACRSMAVVAVEPDAALWSRIHEILAGLGDPW